jgi:hypothetical protein
VRECFVEKSFYAGGRKIIHQANEIIEHYRASGLTLTLRQLYYQFVSRGYIANKQTEYKRLGSVINHARLAGYIDWDAIEDRTRWLRAWSNYVNPSDWISQVLHQYREDLWREQEAYCEVWIEKDALVSVVEKACAKWRVPFFACRGYASQSELYEAGRRLAEQRADGRKVYVFHLGDHDPSGIDMTRDNSERIAMFARSLNIDVKRLALNMNQIEEYEPPPNPAKETDSRFAGYAEIYGDESWELDALDPTVMIRLIDDAISSVCDVEDFEDKRAQEIANRDRIRQVSESWDTVQDFIDYMRDESDSLTL